jgi:hypothetical protein
MIILVEQLILKNNMMKTAEILLHYMDQLHKIVRAINTWIDKGSEFFQKAKTLVQKVIDYIERAIDALVQAVGGRKSHTSLMGDDYMFV